MLIMDSSDQSGQNTLICPTNSNYNISNNYNNEHYEAYSTFHPITNTYELVNRGNIRQDTYRLHHQQLQQPLVTANQLSQPRAREQSNHNLHYNASEIDSKFQSHDLSNDRTTESWPTSLNVSYYDSHRNGPSQSHCVPNSNQVNITNHRCHTIENSRYICSQSLVPCNKEHQIHADSGNFNYPDQYLGTAYSQSPNLNSSINNPYPILNCYAEGVETRQIETAENSTSSINVSAYHQPFNDDRHQITSTDHHVTVVNDSNNGLNISIGPSSYDPCYSANADSDTDRTRQSNHVLTYNYVARISNGHDRQSTQNWADQFVLSSNQSMVTVDGGPRELPSNHSSTNIETNVIPKLEVEDQTIDATKLSNDRGPFDEEHATLLVDSFGSNNNSFKIAGHVTARQNRCSICGRNYARPSTLKTHLRTHTNERPFKCNVCSKTFSQAANLTAHQRVHTGERPFSCPICSRQFSQSSSVITHLRTHSGERPYRCNLCTRTFSDSSTLTKHCRIHSGEKPYQCDYCPLNFSQSGNLSRHLRLHLVNNTNNHGNNISTTTKAISKTCSTSTT